MDAEQFEGTRILEKLAEINQVDAFFNAVDSDNFKEAIELMKLARINPETILLVLGKMAESNSA